MSTFESEGMESRSEEPVEPPKRLLEQNELTVLEVVGWTAGFLAVLGIVSLGGRFLLGFLLRELLFP